MLSDGEPIQDVGFLLFSKSVGQKVDGILQYNKYCILLIIAQSWYLNYFDHVQNYSTFNKIN